MMKLTEDQLANQVTEFVGRDGITRKIEPFVPHRKPDGPPTIELFEVPLPGGGQTIKVETGEHSGHAVVINSDIGHRSFVVNCDGTITSAQG